MSDIFINNYTFCVLSKRLSKEKHESLFCFLPTAVISYLPSPQLMEDMARQLLFIEYRRFHEVRLSFCLVREQNLEFVLYSVILPNIYKKLILELLKSGATCSK